MKPGTTGECFAESGGSPPLDALARTLPTDHLPDLLADLARAQAIVFTRLVTPTSLSAKSELEADVLLSVEDAAPTRADPGSRSVKAANGSKS